jgi:hypothetical protein
VQIKSLDPGHQQGEEKLLGHGGVIQKAAEEIMESARQIQDDVLGLNLPTFHGLCGHCKDQPHDDLYV